MGFQLSGIAEVSDQGGQGTGTGYLIADRLVLTAGHLVGGPPDGICVVRFLDEDQWWDCRVLWRGEESGDAALLEITDPGWKRPAPAEPTRWGTLMGSGPVDCTVTGFLAFTQGPDRRRDVEQLTGQVNPISGSGRSQWVIHSQTPVLSDSERSPLAGMSGAPVFAGDLLIGVLTSQNHVRLQASRISQLALSAEFVALISARSGLPFLVESVELAEVLQPPLPQRRVTSPAMLIAARVEAVRFRGRHEELADLTAWCEGDGVGAHVIAAPGGFGKTRLAMELAAGMVKRGWAAGTLKADVEPDWLDAIIQVQEPILIVIDYGELHAEQIRQLVDRASLRPPAAPVRILILARSTKGWWDKLRTDATSAAREIFNTATVSRLAPLEDTEGGRFEAFQQAVSDYAELLRQFPGLQGQDWDVIARTVSPPDLNAPDFDAALGIQIAALSALLRATPGTVGLIEAIRAYEAQHERDFRAGLGGPAPQTGTSSDRRRPVSQGRAVGETEEGHSLRTRGFGDRFAESDLLGREALVNAVADLLAPLREIGEPSEARQDAGGPTVVALEGPWGSGKTTMMRLIEKELGRRQQLPTVQVPKKKRPWPRRQPEGLSVAAADRVLRARSPGAVDVLSVPAEAQVAGAAAAPVLLGAASSVPQPTVVTAYFNPWAHQASEQIWAGLTRSIVEAAQPTLGADARTRERYWLGRNRLRLDRRHLRRTLWRSVSSPLLRLAVFALLIPVVAQLIKGSERYNFLGLRLSAPVLALLLPLALLGLGSVHTAGRYLLGRARSFLPGEILDGPVLSGALASGTVGGADVGLRDPYYNARSGYLYLVQHDIRDLLSSLKDSGHELVVFIDDLDRCSPDATADVFEAINLFLSGALYGSMVSEEPGTSLPICRFVIGLDPAVVAAHLDRAYKDLGTSKALQADEDPSWGWTFLRKLIQLPVALPQITDDNLVNALSGLLGAVIHPSAGQDTEARPEGSVEERPPTQAAAQPAAPVPDVTRRIQPQSEAEARARALETHPLIRARIQERLCARTNISIREAKRLLTIWQFYLRVLGHKERGADQLSVEQALHLVVLAEIIARWPAMQSHLRRPVDGVPGLQVLARNLSDDIAWASSRIRIGLDGEQHARACEGLRVLLHDYEGEAVAAIASQL
ncbi:MAG: hypothetical protein JWN52_182 [Actinomycetia bacterium]|nr:hypothetical protein [Actinomycetes bacterium]